MPVTLYCIHGEGLSLNQMATSVAMYTYLVMKKVDFVTDFRRPSQCFGQDCPAVRDKLTLYTDWDGIVRLVEKITGTTQTWKDDHIVHMSNVNTLAIAENCLSWLALDPELTVNDDMVFPFPVHWILSRRRRKFEVNRLQLLGYTDCTLDRLENLVHQCLITLNSALGPRNYFFADSPTHLDAVVFGHLVTLRFISERQDRLPSFCLHSQWKGSCSNNDIQQWPHLTKFFDNIYGKYFADTDVICKIQFN